MILDDKPLDRYTLNVVSDFLISDEFKNLIDLTDDIELGINLCHTVIKNLVNHGTLRDLVRKWNDTKI